MSIVKSASEGDLMKPKQPIIVLEPAVAFEVKNLV
jgi:hypothetical protein